MTIFGFHIPPWTLFLALAGFLLSLAGATLFVVFLPADYFVNPQRGSGTSRPRSIPGLLLRAAKNMAGWVLILLGIALSVPGIPGQGLLTILIGIFLIDFPGKYRLERKIIRFRRVKQSIDRLRVKFGKEPLQAPEENPPPAT